jgi:hypothetical protein
MSHTTVLALTPAEHSARIDAARMTICPVIPRLNVCELSPRSPLAGLFLCLPQYCGRFTNSGILAMLMAMRRASSRVSNPAAVRRPGSVS